MALRGRGLPGVGCLTHKQVYLTSRLTFRGFNKQVNRMPTTPLQTRESKSRRGSSSTGGSKPPRDWSASPSSLPRETRSSLLRKSVSHALGDLNPSASPLSFPDSPGSPGDTIKSANLRRSLLGTPTGAGGRASPCATPPSGGIAFELCRLRDEAQAQAALAAAAEQEAVTLRHQLATKDAALSKAAEEKQGLTNRMLGAEAHAAELSQTVKTLEADVQRLQAEANTAGRQADKAVAKLHALPKDDGLAPVVAALEGALNQIKISNDALNSDNKGAYNQLRAKDKELDVAAKQVAEAATWEMQCKVFENHVLELLGQIAELQGEASTHASVMRMKDAEVAKMADALEIAELERDATIQSLAAASDDLKVSREAEAQLMEELLVQRDELTRVSKVAARATSREIRGGIKDAGTIPVPQYLEEVRFFQSEIERLRGKLGEAERSAASTQAQKMKLLKRLDALGQKSPPAAALRGIPANHKHVAGFSPLAQATQAEE
ncbi:hypothetical protein WJX73_007655 [Symbiochloris irregularis]|uniref:Uncharacterized protein n=1 Tax=Symbiochloris irregularis TaxID=706552 RepID=A0AAW1NY23_9CHLO